MNKPYFAKYIPVEGKIKEGDKILCFYSHNHVELHEDWQMAQSHDCCKKAKLFLCSRDIQVGDKIKSPELIDCVYDSNINNQNIRVRWENDFMTTDDKRNYFKVIGQISPEATWIKEGDEFDEYQIWSKNIVFWGNRYVMIQPHAWNEPRPADKGWSDDLIKIKGPCGYFH